MMYKEIVNESGLPWLELNIEVPHQEMLQEAITLKDEFVKHRDEDNGSGYSRKGRRSLWCLLSIVPIF